MTTVLWPIYFAEYLIRVCANFVELGCGIVLPRLEVGVMAFIVVEFNEPLIGVMDLVSLQPDLRDGLINRPSSACRWSSFFTLRWTGCSSGWWGLDRPFSHFIPALWFERSCTLTSLCSCRLRHYDRSAAE
jgi:hypothetical protein